MQCFFYSYYIGSGSGADQLPGVARNASGNVLSDQNIKLRLSIRSGNANGLIVYQETRSLRTNAFGMFVVAIGSKGASNVIGSVEGVNWAVDGEKLLQVELDATGGNNFINMGSTQLLSVPYALHAASAVPGGMAGGDLNGEYPSPIVEKIQGIAVSNMAPLAGQVLKFDGLQWSPGIDDNSGGGGINIPYSAIANSSSGIFSITNSGNGHAIEGINSASSVSGFGVLGSISSVSAGENSAGVRGSNASVGTEGFGVWGSHAGFGPAVYGSSASGIGVKGFSNAGYGIYAQADGESAIGLFATSNNGIPAYIDVSNSQSFFDALFVNNNGFGSGITTIASAGNGLLGIANDAGGAAVIGINNSGGEAVVGRTFSNMAAGVVGRNDGSYAGVRGYNVTEGGTGILAQANVDGAANGNALVAELQSGEGNTAVFKANGVNVARIDHTGKGYFNGGTVAGGADVAEYFEVNGTISMYEPGDVLVIAENADRKVERSSRPYSALVAGVYATKPGLYLTEENAVQNKLDHMAPMGVIGVIPTKVCLEGGIIRRGDMLVTSSVAGVAMKADPDKVKLGQVLGKALQNFDGQGVGKINVLVSVK